MNALYLLVRCLDLNEYFSWNSRHLWLLLIVFVQIFSWLRSARKLVGFYMRKMFLLDVHKSYLLFTRLFSNNIQNWMLLLLIRLSCQMDEVNSPHRAKNSSCDSCHATRETNSCISPSFCHSTQLVIESNEINCKTNVYVSYQISFGTFIQNA